MDVCNQIERIRYRSDLTDRLYHMTKPSNRYSYNFDEQDVSFRAVDNLIEILKSQKLVGSNRLIKGKYSVVCFQDVPFLGLCENIEYEKKLRLSNDMSSSRPVLIRYCGIGLSFFKNEMFKLGARPVIYDNFNVGQEIVDKKHLWRAVEFNLMDEDHIIDFTHEREWRILGDVSLRDVGYHILIDNLSSYDYFIDSINRTFTKESVEQLKMNTFIMEARHPECCYHLK